jgi:polysaccharide deacetylase family protein (PEP-CTERM system associated)
LTGSAIRCYRAPCFSITRSSLWALEVLAELGVAVDSSIFPVRNWRYGIPNSPRHPYAVDTTGRLWEAPLSVRSVGRWTIPAAGGAYFRIYPYSITAANFRSAEKRGQPIIFYIHPWELDPEHPFVPFHWKACVTHYWNLGKTERKLRRLLTEFRFETLGSVLAQLQAKNSRRVASPT